MTATARNERGLDELTSAKNLRLNELADRATLSELLRSFYALFGIATRIFSDDGQLLADATSDLALCEHINSVPAGRAACTGVVNDVKNIGPVGDVATHDCFNGARYMIMGIDYDGSRLGRLVIGPYMPSSRRHCPEGLVALGPGLDTHRSLALFGATARFDDDAMRRFGDHARTCLSLLLFSGHKTLVTSQMHLASVRESYSDLREKNARLHDAVEQLRAADRLKSSFLATVSHELRTPLTSIIGYSEMLLEGFSGNLTTASRECVVTIHEKGQQLLQLITNLLDLSRLDIGKTALHRASLRLDDLLRDVVLTLTPAARKKNVDLRLDIDGALPEQIGDIGKLRQVFLNLADNALKFTPRDGTVTLSARALACNADDNEGDGFVLFANTPEHIEVRVVDTGIGVPPAEAQRVFDAFYQVDSSVTRQFGGSGLGLAIAKRLVDAHGGQIRIEANDPCGAVVIVTLPIAPP